MISTARRLLILTVAVFITGLLQVASAQRQGMGMRSPEEQVKMLKDSLSLTADQVKKLTKIVDASQKETQSKMGEFQGDRDAMRAYMQMARAKSDSLIKAELTKDQVKKYEEIQKARQQRMQNRPPRNN
jgi:Spy/CpxP family protein refolding chaperone